MKNSDLLWFVQFFCNSSMPSKALSHRSAAYLGNAEWCLQIGPWKPYIFHGLIMILASFCVCVQALFASFASRPSDLCSLLVSHFAGPDRGIGNSIASLSFFFYKGMGLCTVTACVGAHSIDFGASDGTGVSLKRGYGIRTVFVNADG